MALFPKLKGLKCSSLQSDVTTKDHTSHFNQTFTRMYLFDVLAVAMRLCVPKS